MDDLVRQAMAKWPNVPDCYGWLGLDMRGRWFMRDDRTQATGPFPTAKGSQLLHEKLISFIHRNYAADEAGRWFFQNGPQRVYVELELTPLVWRLGPGDAVASHTGGTATVTAVYVDELGRLYLDSENGFGVVHSLDVEHAAHAIDEGRWNPVEIASTDLERRFGFVRSPQQRLGHA